MCPGWSSDHTYDSVGQDVCFTIWRYRGRQYRVSRIFRYRWASGWLEPSSAARSLAKSFSSWSSQCCRLLIPCPGAPPVPRILVQPLVGSAGHVVVDRSPLMARSPIFAFLGVSPGSSSTGSGSRNSSTVYRPRYRTWPGAPEVRIPLSSPPTNRGAYSRILPYLTQARPRPVPTHSSSPVTAVFSPDWPGPFVRHGTGR